jgi:TatA/E family protein of Tat protein translocase
MLFVLIIVVVVIVVLFGAKRFTQTARSLGRGAREFKEGLTEEEPEGRKPLPRRTVERDEL